MQLPGIFRQRTSVTIIYAATICDTIYRWVGDAAVWGGGIYSFCKYNAMMMGARAHVGGYSFFMLPTRVWRLYVEKLCALNLTTLFICGGRWPDGRGQISTYI